MDITETSREGAAQVAVVTGGSSGIGLATALVLLEQGAHVVIADRRAPASDHPELAAHAGRYLFAACDVTLEADVAAMFGAAQRRFGPVRALVHSAGIGLETPFLATTVAEFRRVVDINLAGTFIVGRAAALRMRDSGGGAIVNIASASGLVGNAGRAAYGASKGGVVTLTKVMAVELAACGIRVNAVAPGAIETPLVAQMHSAETRAGLHARIPQRRYGTPREVATLIAALLDDGISGYCTGQVIAIDGGMTAAGLLAAAGKDPG